MWDAGEPDDAVCEIRRCILGNESVKPTDEFRNGEFFGKNNASVDASGFVPLLGELEEVFVVEREDRSSMACGKGQLYFIRTTQIPSVPCRDAVNPTCAKQRRHGHVDVFVQIDFHATRPMRKDGVWDYKRESISGADRCSTMSLSSAARLS
jgi:hypothetical protein